MVDTTHTRRRLLAALGSLGATGALAGCTDVLGSSDGGGSDTDGENASAENATEMGPDAGGADDDSWVEPPDSAEEWTTTTENDAEVTVQEADTLDLRVNQCSTADASTRVADGTGTLRVAFDYTTEAEAWFESPGVYVVEDGEERSPLADDPDASIDVTEYETVEDRVETTVEVDGQVDLGFRIEPSTHCDNGDHANTYLRVRNLVIEEIIEETQPN